MTVAEMLKAQEGKTLEFKRDLSSPRNILKSVAAFANTAGGVIVIGVDDKSREPLGIVDPLDAEERLCNLIFDSITPRLVPNIEITTVEGRTLLLAEVFLSSTRPHWLNAQGPENGVFVRLGSTNRQADRELIAELRRTVEGVSFDERPCRNPQLLNWGCACVLSYRWLETSLLHRVKQGPSQGSSQGPSQNPF